MNRANMRAAVLSACVASALCVHMTAQTDPKVALQSAKEAEKLKGCKTAAPQYENVEKMAARTDRAVAAESLVRLAQCYEKMGDNRSQTVYKRLATYNDQPEAALARTKLEPGARDGGAVITRRLVCGDCATGLEDISPDGRSFVQSQDGLVIRNMATGRILRRLATGLDVGSALFSPDGRQIAFGRTWGLDAISTRPANTEVGPLGVFGAVRTELLVVANRDGAEPQVILDGSSDTSLRTRVTFGWTSDGQSVFVVQAGATDESLDRVRVRDKRMERVGAAPAFNSGLSPDGRYVAYVPNGRAIGQGQLPNIRLRSSDGSGDVQIAAIRGVGAKPTWTEDGEHVLFVSDTGLWSVRVHEGKAVGLPELVRSDVRGDVRPIGVRGGSYYYTERPPAVDVLAIAAMERGGEKIDGKTLTIVRKTVGIYPSWSPDGTRIAFRRRVSGQDPVLVIQSVETGEERLYSHRGMRTASVWWFHDGNSLLAAAEREDGQLCLYRLDVKSGEFKEILSFGSEFMTNDYPIALNDETIYLAARDPARKAGPFDRLVAIDVATRQRREIMRVPRNGTIAGVHLSPDGRRLLLAVEDSSTNTRFVSRVNVDGSDYKELLNGRIGSYIGNAWTPDSRSILYSKRVGDSDEWQVMRMSVDGGPSSFTGVQARDQQRLLIKLNPDGTRLAFSSTESTPELWALDNVVARLK